MVLALAAWPLVTGDAVDPKVEFEYPAGWQRAAADLDRQLAPGTRSLVLPGSLFGFHTWGGTTDPALAPLTDRPSAARFVVPHSDPRATDLLWTVDQLVQEGRAFPGQLPPLVGLMGAGAVVAPFDYDAQRAGSVPPADAARALAAGGLRGPSRGYGPLRERPASFFSLDGSLALPELRRFGAGRGAGPVRVHPRDPATVVDGSAAGLAGLAAFGALPPDRPLLYAADQSPGEMRRLAERGAEFVISDSNRRRAFQNTRLRASAGRTLDPGDAVAEDATVLAPFEDGANAETVAEYSGARWLRGNADVNFNAFPERRPALAFDGDPRTAWIPSGFLRQGTSPYLEVGFAAPRDVGVVELLPYADRRGRPAEVRIAGREYRLHGGWNRLRVNLRDVGSLRIEISRTVAPPRKGGPGGFREVRIPGFRPRERLRAPVLTARALRGVPLDRSGLSVVAERTTSYLPWRRNPPARELQALDARDRADFEDRIERVVELPASRAFAAQAWVSPGVDTPDALLDRLAGVSAARGLSSSARSEGVPGRRAAYAFDGDPAHGWIGAWLPGRPAWLAWTSSSPTRVSSLRLTAPRERVRLPTRVRLVADGRPGPPVDVGPGGLVRLPRPASGRRFRLEILGAGFAPSSRPAESGERAVGIGELRAPGVPRVAAPDPAAPMRGRCGDASVALGGRELPLRPVGRVSELESGGPLRARGCREVRAGPGRVPLTSAAGPLRTDLVRLSSAAPRPAAATGGGRVVSPGSYDEGKVTDSRVDLDGPSWLVLAESYNRGWRASCDGRDLGEPQPVDGFANGWRVDRCRVASFSFDPAGPVLIGYVISAIAALVLVALLLLRRPGPLAPEPAELSPSAGALPARSSPAVAVAVGLVAALVLGYVFAIRAGVVLGPLVALVLWRGVGARALGIAAALLLGVVVPVIYLVALPEDRGGFNSSYANDLLGAHWISVAAVVCAALAAWRVSTAIRRRAGARSPAP